MGSTETTKNTKNDAESTYGNGNHFVAYLTFTGIFFVIFVVNILLLIGLYYWPRWIGVLFILLYYMFNFTIGNYEMKDGAPWKYFSQNFFAFHIMRNHIKLKFQTPLPKELIHSEKEQEKEKEQATYIMAMFPHGVSSDHRILMEGILHTVLPNVHTKVRTLAASVLFRIPLAREIALWTGCIDARRKVAERALDKGFSLLVHPGGMPEQLRTKHGKELVYISKRKGFIKLAMRKGVPVLPIYVFGVNDLYYTSDFIFGLREWIMKNLGMCIPLASGYLGSGFVPLPCETTIVFGKPLSFEMKVKGSPTAEELDEAHAQFCSALKQLFDDNKTKLGFGDRELEMI